MAASATSSVYITPGPGGASDGTAVTGTNTYYSAPSDLRGLSMPSYDLYWTGTVAGTFSVMVSNKPSPSMANDADWKTLALGTAIVQPAGSAAGDYIDLAPFPFRWVRLKYVNASGSGNVFAYVVAK
jgi:hypothetical protein